MEAFETLTIVINVTNGAGAKFCLGANGDSGAILVEGENTITFTKAQLIASTQMFLDTGMFYVTVSTFTTNMQIEFVSATKA